MECDREQFEAWLSSVGGYSLERNGDGVYLSRDVDLLWNKWKNFPSEQEVLHENASAFFSWIREEKQCESHPELERFRQWRLLNYIPGPDAWVESLIVGYMWKAWQAALEYKMKDENCGSDRASDGE